MRYPLVWLWLIRSSLSPVDSKGGATVDSWDTPPVYSKGVAFCTCLFCIVAKQSGVQV